MARNGACSLSHIRCKEHPRYSGKIKPKLDCNSCILIHILRYQHGPSADKKLGSLNPYQYLMESDEQGLEEALNNLEVF
ncbi:MAG: hypothetical protein Q8Q06_04425 [bacterium]|nr:hypothetical protein [bacterium]